MMWRTATLALAAGVFGCHPRAQAPLPEPLPPQENPARVEALETLSRVSVIGASVSAGFGDTVPLHRMIDEAIGIEHQVYDASSSAQFLRPITIGEVLVTAAALRRPTIVIAVDYLFWFGHGEKPMPTRLEHLEAGLALLDRLECPIVIGDLPDVSTADPKMIRPEQIPSSAELAVLNARIQRWARERPRVIVVPLASWAADGDQALWQWDRLHPTPRGQAVLALRLLDAVRSRYPALRPADFKADVASLVKAVSNDEEVREGPGG